MKQVCLCVLLFMTCYTLKAQLASTKLGTAVSVLENDPQMKYGIMSMVVINAATGKMVYQRNENIGLPPASTQKLFTSIAAFDLLGPSFRYSTKLSYRPKDRFSPDPAFYLTGSGDPTLGSWRWKATNEKTVWYEWMQAIQGTGIAVKDSVKLVFVNPGFSEKAFPDGWIWQDIGNYYGAGAHAINWRENQFDLHFEPGKSAGDPVSFQYFDPSYVSFKTNLPELSTGAEGSGDNGYVYLSAADNDMLEVSGTLPAGTKDFSISAAHPNTEKFLFSFLNNSVYHDINPSPVLFKSYAESRSENIPGEAKVVSEHLSPILDSMNYWFLKKSINLYGEAFIKTIAFNKTGFGSTENGVDIIRDFWSERGIEPEALNIIDGSGLSPQNRVTAAALVQAIRYARTRPWYGSFYYSLPEINGMKMKSGSIGGSRAFAGYHKNSRGEEYIFAIMVNNYSGSSSAIVRKMWKVLDVLK